MGIDTSVNEPAGSAPVASDAHALRAGRLSLGLLGIYGSGAITETVITFALGQFLLFYLTIVCGLSGALAGVVGLLSLTVDAFVDPLIGSLSDNLRWPLGRRHPFLIGAPIPAGLLLIVLFIIPTGLHGLGLFAFAAAASLGLRVALSCFQVPYFALGAELSEDYVERSTIVASRVAFGVVGTLIATALSYGLFLAAKGAMTHRAAYGPLMLAFAAIVVASGLFSAFGTMGARNRLHAAPPPAGPRLAALGVELMEVFRNRSFRVLFSAILLFFVAQGVAGPLTLYANTFFWNISTIQIRNLTFIYVGGLAAGILITGFASRRLEKRTVALTGLFMLIAAQLIPAPLRVAGLLPANADVMLILTLAQVVAGVGVSGALIGYQSMMGDAADEHEHLFGARREGLYFAGINFSAKASSGLGFLISGVILDLIGFPRGASAGVAHIPLHTLRELGLTYGPGVAIVSFVSVLILFAYRLDRAGHARVLEALGRAPPSV